MRISRRIALPVMLLCASAWPAVSAGAEPPAAPAYTIESAKERLRQLKDEEGRIGEWVEQNWEKELSASQPDLVLGPRRKGEKEEAFKAREMRLKMAVSGIKEQLRMERKVRIWNQRGVLLSSEIRELLPARLGPYDAGRDMYPLLLGFGWPAGLSVKFRVPEDSRKLFELRYLEKIPARFRLNDHGEVFLVSLGRFWKESDRVTPVIDVPPPGPKLLWEGAHKSWITSVAFRPDGSQVLTAGGDGALNVWDAVTGHLDLHLDNVELALSAAYAPDGATFATGGADCFLRVRDTVDGRELWSAPAEASILSVAFSPDGRYIATGDAGGKIRVWGAQSGKETAVVDLKDAVWTVAFTGTGNGVAAGGDGNTAVLRNLLFDRQTWRKELDWPVYTVAVARERGRIAVAGGGKRVVVLREGDGSVVWSGDMGGDVRCVQFDAAGNFLAGGGSGYTVRVFDAERGELLWTAEIGATIRGLAFNPGGTKLAVGSSDFSVRLFEVTEKDRVVAAYWSPGQIYLERGAAETIFEPPTAER